LIGLAGTAFAINDRSADSLFIYRQQNLSAVQPSTLAHLVSLTSDPRPLMGHTRAIGASCSPRGIGELRNPWSCVVRYGRGRPVRYEVTISTTGTVSGIDPTGQLVVNGCCVGRRPTR
jgi:hypothetical protein